jgi:Tat protein translocase TatB subunit
MFNIGGGELIVIMLIALIVLGPQRLPDAARQIGKAMSDLRRLSTGFQNEVRSAIDVADDPAHVTARRNVLAKESATVEGPADEPSADRPARRPSAQERLAAKEAAAAPATASPARRAPAKKAATPAKKAAARNGTKVDGQRAKAAKATKATPATKRTGTS